MVLRRDTLARIGGLHALVNHLADDNVLGRLVQAQGLGVGLADTVPATTVPETTLRALLRHELRWARTIRALVPGQFAASALQYPMFWAGLAIVLAGGAAWSLGLVLFRLDDPRPGRHGGGPGAGDEAGDGPEESPPPLAGGGVTRAPPRPCLLLPCLASAVA